MQDYWLSDWPTFYLASHPSNECLCDWATPWGVLLSIPLMNNKTEAQRGFSKLAKVEQVHRVGSGIHSQAQPGSKYTGV